MKRRLASLLKQRLGQLWSPARCDSCVAQIKGTSIVVAQRDAKPALPLSFSAGAENSKGSRESFFKLLL